MLRLASRMVAAVSGLERTGVEARLRGLAMRLPHAGSKLRMGRNVEIVGPVDRIRLGHDVTFFGNTYLNVAGDRGRVAVGSRTHIDQFCVLYGQGGLTIGSRCAIAAGVIIYTQTNQFAADPLLDVIDQPVRYAPVMVGDDVWIGAGAILLPGVTVGDHAVIAAGAVVRRDVQPSAVVAGVPARQISERQSRQGVAMPEPPVDRWAARPTGIRIQGGAREHERPRSADLPSLRAS